jgi:hypothetical protein
VLIPYNASLYIFKSHTLEYEEQYDAQTRNQAIRYPNLCAYKHEKFSVIIYHDAAIEWHTCSTCVIMFGESNSPNDHTHARGGG